MKGRKREQLQSDTEIWKTATVLLQQSFEPPTEREKSLKMDNTFFPQPSKCVLPGEVFSELRFKMLSTRGGVGPDRGKGRCISKFIVVTSPDQAVHEFVVDDFATVEVTVQQDSQKEELRSALTSLEIASNQSKTPRKHRMVSNSSAPLLQSAPQEAEGPTIGTKLLSPVESLGLERGWTVISGCDFVADNSSDLERALRAFLEGSSSGTLLIKKTSPKFAELEVKFSDIGLSPQCVTAVTFAVQTHDDLSLDPVSWVVEGLPPGVPQKGDGWVSRWISCRVRPQHAWSCAMACASRGTLPAHLTTLTPVAGGACRRRGGRREERQEGAQITVGAPGETITHNGEGKRGVYPPMLQSFRQAASNH